MILLSRMCCVASTAVAMASGAAVEAAPKASWAATERPLGDDVGQALPKALSHGLCEAPQNADANPSSPVPVVPVPCYDQQIFSAASNTPSTGASCGGFTVAFGPMGDLKPYLDHVTLSADWGDIALTQANCAKARIAAIGWGARCTDDACTLAQWERIGGPKQRKGFWNTTSQVCYIGVSFSSVGKRYKTLNLDVIATVDENGKAERKRAKGTITAQRGNGTCATVNRKL